MTYVVKELRMFEGEPDSIVAWVHVMDNEEEAKKLFEKLKNEAKSSCIVSEKEDEDRVVIDTPLRFVIKDKNNVIKVELEERVKDNKTYYIVG